MSEETSSPKSPRELALERLQKLKIALDETISYRLESVFSKTTGWWANLEIKRRARLILLVEPRLKEMLLQNEQVLYIAKGVQYSFFESYLRGALLAAMLNQTVFVLTNLRLLLIRSKSDGKPLDAYWVIYYSEIVQFTPRWTGMLKLRLLDGKRLTFTGFSRLDRQAMPIIFQSAINDYRSVGFEPAVSQSRETLCAYCFNIVPKDEYSCGDCGADYWTPKQLALRSLVFPSWGDFTMRHYGIAATELTFYVLSWVFAAAQLAGPNPPGGLAVVFGILAFEHPMDAIMTYFVARKGLNPRQGPNPDRVLHLESDERDDEISSDEDSDIDPTW